MKENYNKLFNWFEENRFINDGVYPRNTNLVFSFMEYLEKAENEEEIADKLGLEYNEETETYIGFEKAKEEMTKGCEKWLNS